MAFFENQHNDTISEDYSYNAFFWRKYF